MQRGVKYRSGWRWDDFRLGSIHWGHYTRRLKHWGVQYNIRHTYPKETGVIAVPVLTPVWMSLLVDRGCWCLDGEEEESDVVHRVQSVFPFASSSSSSSPSSSPLWFDRLPCQLDVQDAWEDVWLS